MGHRDDHSEQHRTPRTTLRNLPLQRVPENWRADAGPPFTPVDLTRSDPSPELPAGGRGARAGAVPHLASWRARHHLRTVSGVVLVGVVMGATALGLRSGSAPGPESLGYLVAGLVLVVVLWAVMIAGTPQVVDLRGSILTVSNSRGSEWFDLADGLQMVDVVDHPRGSRWAVVLHRPDGTTLVLRRRHVRARELDSIVRHYRGLAEVLSSEREARFNR